MCKRPPRSKLESNNIREKTTINLKDVLTNSNGVLNGCGEVTKIGEPRQ